MSSSSSLRRFAAAAALVEKYDAVAVLKGAGSLVADPGGETGLCTAGNPGMAVAGMGDVLTGVIGALVAQGLDTAEAARLGVHRFVGAAPRGIRQSQWRNCQVQIRLRKPDALVRRGGCGAERQRQDKILHCPEVLFVSLEAIFSFSFSKSFLTFLLLC